MALKPARYSKPEPLHRPVKKDRKCLRCGEMFWSQGPGQRICHKCRHSNRDVYCPDMVTNGALTALTAV